MVSRNMSGYDSCLFIRKFLRLKTQMNNFTVKPKAIGECFSVATNTIDSLGSMKMSLSILIKILEDGDFEINENVIGDCWEFLKKKEIYFFEAFDSMKDNDKHVSEFKENNFY